MTSNRPPLQLSFEFYEATDADVAGVAFTSLVHERSTQAEVQVVCLRSFRRQKDRAENASLHKSILETIAHMA